MNKEELQAMKDIKERLIQISLIAEHCDTENIRFYLANSFKYNLEDIIIDFKTEIERQENITETIETDNVMFYFDFNSDTINIIRHNKEYIIDLYQFDKLNSIPNIDSIKINGIELNKKAINDINKHLFYKRQEL